MADKLERRPYLILGEWLSSTGRTAVFRADGTCDLMGEALMFRVSNFSVYTGQNEEDMTITHKLSAITQNGMTLRDIRDGQNVVYKFERVGEWDLEAFVEANPAPTPAPQAQPETTPAPDSGEDMLVTEGGDED